jgi:60S ribosome subunit biogenesis protein NIP7
MTFRNLTSVEETILKRSFNNWGIFEVFGSLRILIRNLGLDTAISDQKTNISKHDSISNKILNYNSCGNRSSNTVEKYNNNNQGPFHTPTTRYSNGIEFAESKKNIKRTEVFVHSHVKYDNVLFKKLNPVIIGLKIGTIKNKKFSPGLNFAEFVVKHNRNMDYPHVIVNTKAENLIVFGRDIMGSSILSFFKDIKENQQVIILNHNKEVIGLGKSRYSGSLIIQPNTITIDTTQDIGTYYLKSENRLSKAIDKNIYHLL